MTTESSENSVHINSQNIVFFDGVCGLCNHAVNFLLARDRHHHLRFAALQGKTAGQVIPDEIRDQLSTLVFSERGQLFYRSTAVVRMLMRIGGPWKIVGAALWLIPWPLRDLGYRMVSKIRYRLFGKHETCRLPTPEERQLFID